MIWLLYIAVTLASTVLWTVIHEMSHVGMAKILGDVVEWKVKLYPNRDENGNWRFASAWYRFTEMPSDERRAVIQLAPRIPGLLAMLLIPLATLLSGAWKISLLIVLASGIVDFVQGSLGISESSDLRKASDRLKWSPWVLRMAGLLIATPAIVMTLAILFA